MNVVTARAIGTVTLTAPIAGRVVLGAPRALCGELEVFERGEVVASVDGGPVEAPERGFVLRALVGEGARVLAGDPIVEYRIV